MYTNNAIDFIIKYESQYTYSAVYNHGIPQDHF